ncbi:hypothetical protein [Haloquadratum walsbyi]|jgi:hypothetical protein|uniref:Uncharacterized protein n=1 Tax=Haloquadratum walsbyi J07HQW2 TaxID=1238425 RepID=U1NEY6_9EURY|nr:hypothetical protein [Haloquadratum walsbyi]ERG95620.1 MAG: hypothetical protein J07HQW2_02079 [Haloquadratum walsbyi J07HQW2]
MKHDRIHAQPPSHDTDRWSVGTIVSVETQDGHCAVTVQTAQGNEHELTVTIAVRDLFLSRLDVEIELDTGDEPKLNNAIGERVWYRARGE